MVCEWRIPPKARLEQALDVSEIGSELRKKTFAARIIIDISLILLEYLATKTVLNPVVRRLRW